MTSKEQNLENKSQEGENGGEKGSIGYIREKPDECPNSG